MKLIGCPTISATKFRFYNSSTKSPNIKNNIRLHNMALNEDYFRDIDITEDDIICSDDCSYRYNYPDSKSLLTDMMSKYTHCAEIAFCNKYKEDTEWADNIYQDFQYLIDKFKYIFELYAISFSEPIFMDCDIISDFKSSDNHSFEYCCDIYNNIIEHNGFRFIAHRHIHIEKGASMLIFFDLPQFNTYRQAFRFISVVLNSIKSRIEKKDAYLTMFNSSRYGFNYGDNFLYVYSDFIGDFLKIPNTVMVEFVFGAIEFLCPGKSDELNTLYTRYTGSYDLNILRDFLIKHCLYNR